MTSHEKEEHRQGERRAKSEVQIEPVPQPHSILIADDDVTIRDTLRHLFEDEGYRVSEASTGNEVLDAIRKEDKPDLVFLDIRMPELNGIDVLKRMREMKTGVGAVIMTAYGTSNLAIQSIQLGAYDYMTKPFDTEDVLQAARRYFEHKQRQEEVQKARKSEIRDPKVEPKSPIERLVGKHPAMLKVHELIDQASSSDNPVLITGESGTGKELVAEVIYRSSQRMGPLVKIACATLPESLFLSELFGHEKGSFASSYQQRKGRFELADRGTIFLDEIGEMTARTQTHLLRVLKDGEFERFGGNKTIKVDARIIASTNKDLAEEMRKGNFLPELYDHLHPLQINLPPLRDRQSDIAVLTQYFLDKFRYTPHHSPSQISSEAMRLLEEHTWPGNVRQLENAIEYAVLITRGGLITPEHFKLRI